MNKALSPTGMNAGFATRLVGRVALAAFLGICNSTALTAQNAWDAILNIDPYPSPYYSDWDNNPNIASLTVINPGAAQQVRIHFNVTNRANKVVLSGSSDPQSIGARATVVFDNPYDVAGSTHHDEEEERIAARTGRLREGEYTACTVVADLTGFSLAESCAPFTIVYPDPPLLLTPENREVITQTDPLFQWTPVQVPIDFQLNYVVRVVEILNGQTPQEALRSNIPHFQSLDGQFPSLRYPIDARPFEVGKQYAWTVQVLDQNGYAASANDGRSEIWTFAYGENAVSQTSGITLTVRNSADAADQTITGLPAVCREWDTTTSGTVDVPMQSAFAFPRLAKVNATLVREVISDSDNQRVWAIYGSNDTHTLMLAGDCLADLGTRVRWLGIRTVNGAQELAEWVPGDTTAESTDAPGATLKFGVAILSFYEEKAGVAETSIMPIREFLDGREVELKPGLNLLGVLDAHTLGFLDRGDRNAEIELQGFAGVNLNVSVEGRVGSEGVSHGTMATAEYVTLRGALPERHPDKGPFKSTRFSLELSLGDTLGIGAKRGPAPTDSIEDDRDFSRHIALKLILTGVTPSDITWTGALEFDWNFTKREFLPAPTLRLSTDHRWPKEGPLGVGNLELAVGVSDGLLASIKSGSTTDLDASITGRGSLILYDEDIAKVAITVGKHAAAATDSQRIAAAQLLASSAITERDKAMARGDTAGAAAWEKKHRDHVADIANWTAQFRADSLARSRPKSAEQTATASKASSDAYVRLSFTLGNMGFGNLLDLLDKAARALAQK